MAKIIFLKVGDFRVIDEVLTLMDSVQNPSGSDKCQDLPEMLQAVAAQLPETLKGPSWRKVTGSSGGIYPVYFSKEDPFVVYAAVKRDLQPDEMLVMHVGMCNGRTPSQFFRYLNDEVDRRIALQGWLP